MPEINSPLSKEHLDCMAQHIIVSALDSDELLKISECTSAKECGIHLRNGTRNQ